MDLRKFISFAKVAYDLPVLQEFLDATPSAELLPILNGSVQTDTEEMGFEYEELSVLGRLRKVSLLGNKNDSGIWRRRVSPLSTEEEAHFVLGEYARIRYPH
jgi:NAD+ synthase (glutamine-hydrolysing)